jgi:hypothetical protein
MMESARKIFAACTFLALLHGVAGTAHDEIRSPEIQKRQLNLNQTIITSVYTVTECAPTQFLPSFITTSVSSAVPSIVVSFFWKRKIE